ncbi:MAG: DNA topoisomerase IV subunit A [Alphaproteobacteria bacterium]
MSDQTPFAHDLIEKPFGEILSEKYLSYALSTIMSRSLPDVRDGLKPVHRRLLYAMRQLSLTPDRMPKKSARVVGDVIGKYHPHGDTAVYDAMVRVAQDFAQRFPLVDGQGNFGNIDGDNAAAMRYTEARLTDVALAMLDQLEEDTVDFRGTYDGEGKEPIVLPAAFPNLLANGATGIAVGMACSVPPHNVGELCGALQLLIDKPESDVAELVKLIPGPDFPTGGELVEGPASILKAYETGRGGFRLRARWEIEKLGAGQYQIIVTEIPYLVQKSRLIEKIADLITSKKIPILDDVADESAEDIRIVLTPKSRNVEPEMLMAALFRMSDLETRISLNMNVLDGGVVPRVMNLKEVLQAFINHRHEVLERRSRHRLAQIEHRLEVLEGYLIAFLNIDEVIRIIRFEDHPKQTLMDTFDLSEVQADAILNLRLRRLHKLEEIEIKAEHSKLAAERDDLNDILSNPARRRRILWEQMGDIAQKFGGETELGRRRTIIGEEVEAVEMPMETLIEKEPITMLVSNMGWIRAMKGHVADVSEVRYKDGDEEGFVIRGETTDKLLILCSNGRVLTIGCDKLPGGRGFGEHLRLKVDIAQDVEIIAIRRHQPGALFIMASDDGRGFRAKSEDLIASTKAGKQVLNVKAPFKAAAMEPIGAEDDHLAVIGTHRRLLIYPLDEINQMARGKGVMLQKYAGARLSDLKTFKLEEGLSWPQGEKTRTESDLMPWLGKRGQVGRMPPHGFPQDNSFGKRD